MDACPLLISIHLYFVMNMRSVCILLLLSIAIFASCKKEQAPADAANLASLEKSYFGAGE